MIDKPALIAEIKRRGLTHKELARKARICRSAVTKLLNDYGDPSYTTLAGIVKALNLTPEEISRIFFHNDDAR